MITHLTESDKGVDELPGETQEKTTVSGVATQVDEDEDVPTSPNSLAKLSCGKILIMLSMYNTGGDQTGMKMNMSLQHIVFVDTRQENLSLKPQFRQLLEIRSYEMPYAFSATFSQGDVLRGSSVKKQLAVCFRLSQLVSACLVDSL